MSVPTLPVLPLFPTATASQDACWSTIGVQGDKSCERLAAVTHCRNCPVFSAAGEQLLHRPSPPGYLEEWTARLAQPDVTTKRAEHSVLIFRVGPEWLALETRLLVEVTDQRPVHRIPHSQSRVLAGLTNVRGRLEICVSLRELLGVGGETSVAGRRGSAARMLVVEHASKRWVLAVDEVHGLQHFHAEEVTAAPATVARGPGHVRGLLPWRDQQVGYVDADKLFAALEGRLT